MSKCSPFSAPTEACGRVNLPQPLQRIGVQIQTSSRTEAHTTTHVSSPLLARWRAWWVRPAREPRGSISRGVRAGERTWAVAPCGPRREWWWPRERREPVEVPSTRLREWAAPRARMGCRGHPWNGDGGEHDESLRKGVLLMRVFHAVASWISACAAGPRPSQGNSRISGARAQRARRLASAKSDGRRRCGGCRAVGLSLPPWSVVHPCQGEASTRSTFTSTSKGNPAPQSSQLRGSRQHSMVIHSSLLTCCCKTGIRQRFTLWPTGHRKIGDGLTVNVKQVATAHKEEYFGRDS